MNKNRESERAREHSRGERDRERERRGRERERREPSDLMSKAGVSSHLSYYHYHCQIIVVM
jgi:hypothetical protein